MCTSAHRHRGTGAGGLHCNRMAPTLPRWEVVGGADKGGIIVREGVGVNSTQVAERLATGSIVEEVARSGDRLKYRTITGSGPPEGWVSIRLKDKVLLEPHQVPAQAAAEAKSPPKPAQAPRAEPDGKSTAPNGKVDFATRIAKLKDDYAHVDLEIPDDAEKWTQQELEMYFESGGFIKPASAAKPKVAAAKPKPKAKDDAPSVSQFSTSEAQEIQEQLREGFADKSFQQSLKKLQNKYPKRKEKGNPEGTAFFEAFEALTLTVYYKVLPKWGLNGDWEGVRDMHAKMYTAMMHPKVKKQQEEINTLLGLPRDAVFKPGKKAEELYTYCPEGNGTVAGYPLAMVEDAEGDAGHEFFVEDPKTGQMRKQGPSALE